MQQWEGPPPRIPYGYPQPPPYAPPPIDPARLRPRSWWYAAAAIPGALGIAGIVVCVVLAVNAFPDTPSPFNAPGSRLIVLDKSEEQTIYKHTAGRDATPVAGAPDCRVRRLSTRRFVPLERAGNESLTINNDTYLAELHFEAPGSGRYRVSCRPPVGVALQTLAIGERADFVVFGVGIAGAIASAFVGFILAAAVAVLVAVLRSRHKKRLQQEAMGRPPA